MCTALSRSKWVLASISTITCFCVWMKKKNASNLIKKLWFFVWGEEEKCLPHIFGNAVSVPMQQQQQQRQQRTSEEVVIGRSAVLYWQRSPHPPLLHNYHSIATNANSTHGSIEGQKKLSRFQKSWNEMSSSRSSRQTGGVGEPAKNIFAHRQKLFWRKNLRNTWARGFIWSTHFIFNIDFDRKLCLHLQWAVKMFFGQFGHFWQLIWQAGCFEEDFRSTDWIRY